MSLRHLALMIGFCAFVAACSSTSPPMRRFPDLTFTNLTPIQLDIGRIEVVSQFLPPAQSGPCRARPA